MTPTETLSGSMMRFMRERQGEQPWAASEAVEIRIGGNQRDRFNLVVLRGSNGWFDVGLADRSYMSIRPPWSEPPADPTPIPRTLDELRDGAKAVCEAYRMLNEAVERLHDGNFAADRAALNSFAETTLLRTRAMHEFLFQRKSDWVSAADFINTQLQAPSERTLQSISDRVIHISYEGASSKHEYFWRPRPLFKVIVDGMEAFIGHLELISQEQASWFRSTHDYVLSRKAYLVPMGAGRLEYAMVTTAGAIMTTLGLSASNQFLDVGRDYYRKDIPPF